MASSKGFGFLSEEEKLYCFEQMDKQKTFKLSQDMIEQSIKDTKDPSPRWKRVTDASVMQALVQYVLSDKPQGMYVWFNDKDAVFCKYDAETLHFCLENVYTGETFLMTREQGPDQLLTSQQVPGIHGTFSLFFLEAEAPVKDPLDLQPAPKKIKTKKPALPKKLATPDLPKNEDGTFELVKE